MAKKSAKKGGVSVDFTGVEAGGGRAIPDGEYIAEVDEVTLETSSESGAQYLKWVFKVPEGKYKGVKIWDNTSLQPQALWRLRQLLEAMEVEVPDGAFDLELEEYVGNSIGLVIQNEKYQGKDKPRVVGYFIASEEESSEETEEEEGETEEEETEEEETEEETEEEEEEEEAPPPKASSKKKKGKPEIKAGMTVTFEDDGEEYTGKVIKIEDDVATVKVKKDEWEIAVNELTPTD